MRHLLLALVVLTVPALPARAVDKEAINGAIDRGVTALKKLQGQDGAWPYQEIGASALAALTLLECGVPKTDKAITRAADKIREDALTVNKTYSISLCIMFLDRLDESRDTPLIESLIVRLLAGQQASGGWSYTCPTVGADEVKRLKAEMGGERVLKGGRDLGKLPAKGRRKVDDLPAEIQAQLKVIAKGPPPAVGQDGALKLAPDNSNTQFATLALWIGRRYGVPTQGALIKLYDYFQSSQMPDGGWTYMYTIAPLRMPKGMPMPGLLGPSAAMTCAGLMGLAVGHGAAFDVKKAKNDKTDKQDLSKDAGLKLGLQALASAVGTPLGWDGTGQPPANIPKASGKSYYFFWSLERVAVILQLKTIGKKDWYSWGAEILLANQRADGSWAGEYATSGADTCFALLFLKKSNLAEDLMNAVTGLTDPGDRQLRAGGIGGAGLKGGATKLTPSGLGGPRTGGEGKSTTGTPRPRPAARTAEEKSAYKVADDLVKARPEARAALIKQLRENKGVAYTDALVYVIGELDAAGRRDARAALAQRFTRLKGTTLREYLKDKDPEVRRASALAIASKELKELCPDLINRLDDDDAVVARAAQAALKELSGKDFGPRADATPAERKKAVADWLAWWKKQAGE